MEVMKAMLKKLGETLGIETRTMTREEVVTLLLWSEIENLTTEYVEPEIFDE